jgi:hypothetical protein
VANAPKKSFLTGGKINRNLATSIAGSDNFFRIRRGFRKMTGFGSVLFKMFPRLTKKRIA